MRSSKHDRKGELFATLSLLDQALYGDLAHSNDRQSTKELRPQAERLRLVGCPSLSFPASDIASISRADDDRITIEVASFGLYGPASPLPTYMTQRIIDEHIEGEHRIRGLVDILNHRLITLLWRVWQKYRLTLTPPPIRPSISEVKMFVGRRQH